LVPSVVEATNFKDRKLHLSLKGSFENLN